MEGRSLESYSEWHSQITSGFAGDSYAFGPFLFTTLGNAKPILQSIVLCAFVQDATGSAKAQPYMGVGTMDLTDYPGGNNPWWSMRGALQPPAASGIAIGSTQNNLYSTNWNLDFWPGKLITVSNSLQIIVNVFYNQVVPATNSLNLILNIYWE